MKSHRLFEIIGLVDDDLILDALNPPHRRHISIPLAAACLTLCAVSLPFLNGFSASKSAQRETSTPSADAPVANASPSESPSLILQNAPFLSYSGPVLPLTTTEKTALTALRRLNFDVSNPDTALIFDHYEITNPTDEEIFVSFLYPVVGSLGNFDQLEPRMGDWNRMTTPYAGRYAGSFQSAHGSDDPNGTHNLKAPDEWTDYTAVMENGDLDYALSNQEPLSEMVTVYEFSDITGPTDQYKAAALAIDFTIQPEASSIMTYGFNGSTWDDLSGWYQYDFFIPNGQRRDTNPKLLVVRGEDLPSYRIQGYSDGSCTTPINGASCSVTRTEMTMERLIDRLCRAYLQENADNFSGLLNTDPQTLPLKLYRQAVTELLTEYGMLSDTPTDRYAFGRLDDLVAEALTLERIFYFRTPEVTIAPGESYTMTVTSGKTGSFDFYGSNSEREGIRGYEFLSIGSALTFTEQSLSIDLSRSDPVVSDPVVDEDISIHTPTIPAHNLPATFTANTEVLLDSAQEYYYFHITS